MSGCREIMSMPSKSVFLRTQNTLNKAIRKNQKISALAMEQEMKISKIIEHSPLAKIITDSELNILGFNPAFLHYIGYSREELDDLNILDLIQLDESEKQTVTDNLKNMGKGKIECNLHFKKKGGDIVHGKLIGHWFHDTDIKEKQIIVQILDLTSEIEFRLKIKNLNKLLSEKVAEQTKAINKQNKNLKYLNHAMSHDLKAPIKTIEGLFEVYMTLEDTVDIIEKEQCEKHIKINIRRMDDLTEELNIFFSVQNNDIKRETYNPIGQIKEIIETFKVGLYKKRVMDLKIGQLPNLYVDKKAFYHVWQNLIGNALKYASKRAIIQLKIEGYCVNGNTFFSISDNGVGFSADEKMNLFKPFKRLSSSKNFPGTGLGLPIVKEIIDRHQGKIWAESTLNQGSTFNLSLPKKETIQWNGGKCL